MPRLRPLFHRLFGLFRRRSLEREMSEELQAHLDGLIERNLAAGMPAEEARFAAMRAFGGVEQTRERARDERRSAWMEHLLQDLRYAMRQSRKHPGFTLIVVLIVALGIGANTAVFSALEVLLLRPLPVGEPSELVVLRQVRKQGGAPVGTNYITYPAFEQIRDEAKSFTGAAVLNASGGTRALVPSGAARTDAVRVKTSDVSGNYFSVLHVTPALGRLINADDDRKNAPRAVVVLSHAFWERQFGADRGVLGKVVLIENVACEIIGVAAPDFFGVKVGEPIDVWTPLELWPTIDPRRADSLHKSNWNGLLGFARLRPGVSIETASAETGLLYDRLGVALRPEESAADRVRTWGRMELEPGARGFAGDLQAKSGPVMAILLIVALLVQVLACSNIASLSLARHAGRARELAARTALGAGRSRLIRQLVTESMVLVGAGALLGLLFVGWGFLSARSLGLPTRPDGWILLFGIAVSIFTGVLVAVVPALKTSRIDLAAALKTQSAQAGGSAKPRLQQGLVIVQLAVSACLLAGTGLFARTLHNLRNVDLGFNLENLLLVGIDTPRDYDPARRTALSRELLEAIAPLPGVQRVTVSALGLLTGGEGRGTLKVPGYTPGRDEDMSAQFTFAGPGYFATIGLPLVRGRDFADGDVFAGGQAKVSKGIISEIVARRFFGNIDPIGRRFAWGSVEFEIIGVARNTRYRDLRQEAPLVCYVAHNTVLGSSLGFQIRTAGDAAGLVPAIAAAAKRIDPKLRLLPVETIDQKLAQATQQERLILLGIGAFSGLALLLTMLGVYGLLAGNVTQRTKEIGIRIALGGRAGDIIALILKQGIGLAVIGWVAGIVAATVLVRFIEARLYGVASVDPLTFLASGGLIVLVATLACWLPARRATKVDPVIALRTE